MFFYAKRCLCLSVNVGVCIHTKEREVEDAYKRNSVIKRHLAVSACESEREQDRQTERERERDCGSTMFVHSTCPRDSGPSHQMHISITHMYACVYMSLTDRQKAVKRPSVK